MSTGGDKQLLMEAIHEYLDTLRERRTQVLLSNNLGDAELREVRGELRLLKGIDADLRQKFKY